jgi:hypothetical protein
MGKGLLWKEEVPMPNRDKRKTQRGGGRGKTALGRNYRRRRLPRRTAHRMERMETPPAAAWL